MKNIFFIFIHISAFVLAAYETNVTIVLERNATNVTVHEKNATINENEKKALRYGFQQTQECGDFELAFLCIQKCLDLDFDVAHADKKCLCTCFVNRDKAKYKQKSYESTKWRLGAPKTVKPAWILPLIPEEPKSDNTDEEHNNNYDINGNSDNETAITVNGDPGSNNKTGGGGGGGGGNGTDVVADNNSTDVNNTDSTAGSTAEPAANTDNADTTVAETAAA